jgi:hypothetical protein
MEGACRSFTRATSQTAGVLEVTNDGVRSSAKLLAAEGTAAFPSQPSIAVKLFADAALP